MRKFFAFAFYALSCLCCFSQEEQSVSLPVDSFKLNIDSLLIESNSFVFAGSANPCYSYSGLNLSPAADTDDSIFFRKNKKLLKKKASRRNHEKFYEVARVLWKLNRIDEAEKMFLQIFHSDQPYFGKTYSHPSDIPGDNATSTYGYGSYTFNYKHYACEYLCMIYLKRNDYARAMNFFYKAENIYPVEFNCGTGYMMHRQKMDALNAFCLEGLGQYSAVIDLFLPSNNYNEILIRCIKKQYSAKEIESALQESIEKFSCVPDTGSSTMFTIENYGQPDEKTVEYKYKTATIGTSMFGRDIRLISPSFKEDEAITKEKCIEEFKNSCIYRELMAGE